MYGDSPDWDMIRAAAFISFTPVYCAIGIIVHRWWRGEEIFKTPGIDEEEQVKPMHSSRMQNIPPSFQGNPAGELLSSQIRQALRGNKGPLSPELDFSNLEERLSKFYADQLRHVSQLKNQEEVQVGDAIIFPGTIIGQYADGEQLTLRDYLLNGLPLQ